VTARGAKERRVASSNEERLGFLVLGSLVLVKVRVKDEVFRVVVRVFIKEKNYA
jgi:hypothetical protein